MDELRYGSDSEPARAGEQNEYGFLKIRYKLPGEDTSKLISTPITTAVEVDRIEDASESSRFAASVAAFGQLLKGGRYLGSYGFDDVIALAGGARGDDEFGYRSEFLNLVRLAKQF
jgi:Ca-activated chloride channel family protein